MTTLRSITLKKNSWKHPFNASMWAPLWAYLNKFFDGLMAFDFHVCLLHLGKQSMMPWLTWIGAKTPHSPLITLCWLVATLLAWTQLMQMPQGDMDQWPTPLTSPLMHNVWILKWLGRAPHLGQVPQRKLKKRKYGEFLKTPFRHLEGVFENSSYFS